MHMKAVIQSGYGFPDEVLSCRNRELPDVGNDEVLVKVYAASVHADVWHMVRGYPCILRLMGAGFRKPKNPVPGIDLSGIVTSVGKNVTGFKPGDEIFGESHDGIQWRNGGAYAEFASVPESAIAMKPQNVTFDQAASVPCSGYIVFSNYNWEKLNKGDKVLINGAAGGVGSIALQIAKSCGAEITAVDSADKFEQLIRLGADHTMDYRQKNVSDLDEKFDLVFDVASTMKYPDCRHLLKKNGTYVMIGHDRYGNSGKKIFGSVPSALKLTVKSLFDKNLPPANFNMPEKKAIMEKLKELLENGSLTPVVDRTFSLQEVPLALQYLTGGEAKGKIIIKPCE